MWSVELYTQRLMTATAHQCTCFGALLHHAQNHLFSFSILSFYFPFKIDRHRLKEINNLQGCTLQGYVWSFLFDIMLKFNNPFYHDQFWVQFYSAMWFVNLKVRIISSLKLVRNINLLLFILFKITLYLKIGYIGSSEQQKHT